MKNRLILVAFALFLSGQFYSQILTKEDSLSAGLIKSNSATVISGYGNIKYANNLTLKTAETNVDRLILFVGHKFNKKIAFFSELEIEDVKIEGGSPGGEFAIEQAFIKFDINRSNYISAGLLIPRLGIINENHLPTTFNGNDRPMVEKYVIPATFREVGIAYYGTSQKMAGLNYSVAVLNGLNGEGFSAEKGIRGGRYEGAGANANTLAVTAALLYYKNNLRAQVSGYIGGSNTLSSQDADALQLSKGVFGAPVELVECNLQYKVKGFQLKGLVSFINISEAEKMNSFYGNNIAQNILGYYLEAGYNLMHKTDKSLILFSRYENIDMTHKIAANSLYNPANNLQFLTSGLTYLPHQGVAIKLDYVYRLTGTLNSSLVDPNNAYISSQNSIILSLAYSF